MARPSTQLLESERLRVREAFAKRGITQAKIASLTEVSRSSVSKFLNGIKTF